MNANPFANYRRDRQRKLLGMVLKFVKTGFIAGRDRVTIPFGTEFVAAVPWLQLGYQKWVDQQIVDSAMGYYAEGFTPPPRGLLDDTDQNLWAVGRDGKPADPWTWLKLLPFIDPNTDDIYTFITSSSGGINAIDDLAESFGRAKGGTLPLIALGMETYNHKTFGPVNNPKFAFVKYVDAKPFEAIILSALGDEAAALPGREEFPALEGPRDASPLPDVADDYAGHNPSDDMPF